MNKSFKSIAIAAVLMVTITILLAVFVYGGSQQDSADKTTDSNTVTIQVSGWSWKNMSPTTVSFKISLDKDNDGTFESSITTDKVSDVALINPAQLQVKIPTSADSFKFKVEVMQWSGSTFQLMHYGSGQTSIVHEGLNTAGAFDSWSYSDDTLPGATDIDCSLLVSYQVTAPLNTYTPP